MKSSLPFGRLLLLFTLWRQLNVDAIREIVAIGDSITDSCQYGTKYIVDEALDSNKVPRSLTSVIPTS